MRCPEDYARGGIVGDFALSRPPRCAHIRSVNDWDKPATAMVGVYILRFLGKKLSRCVGDATGRVGGRRVEVHLGGEFGVADLGLQKK